HLGARVYTVERLPDLLVEGEERFRRLGLRAIETRLGDGAGGWPERAPFDRIIVTAAAPGVPTPLTEQLAPGGRLVIPVGDLSGQELVILQRGPGGSLTERHAGGVRFVPLISRLSFTAKRWTRSSQENTSELQAQAYIVCARMVRENITPAGTSFTCKPSTTRTTGMTSA